MPRSILVLALVVFIALMSACKAGGNHSDTGAATDSSAADNAADRIKGRRWQWVRTITPVENIEASDSSRYTVLFGNDGQVQAQFDCNSGGGSYEMSEYQISFGVLRSTRMACPEDSQDAVFMKHLGRVTSWFAKDGMLYLEMPMDSGTMHFEPAE